MPPRTLGSSTISISPIIMGTWQAGRQMWADIDDADSIRAIRSAIDAGVTTIDTASIYGDGHSEQIVARAVGAKRSRLVIATKVFANEMKHDQVMAACERSLINLNTDYIDLYQIHWPSGSFGSDRVPIEETMQALVRLDVEHRDFHLIDIRIEHAYFGTILILNLDNATADGGERLGPAVLRIVLVVDRREFATLQADRFVVIFQRIDQRTGTKSLG